MRVITLYDANGDSGEISQMGGKEKEKEDKKTRGKVFFFTKKLSPTKETTQKERKEIDKEGEERRRGEGRRCTKVKNIPF